MGINEEIREHSLVVPLVIWILVVYWSFIGRDRRPRTSVCASSQILGSNNCEALYYESFVSS